MRPSTFYLLPALLATATTAFTIPDFESFFAALPVTLQDYIPASNNNETTPETDLRRRLTEDPCPADFNSCSNLGAVNLCCAPHAVCSPDAGGHVACCPSGKACSGTIDGVITAGTVNSNGALVGATTGGSGALASDATATATTPFAAASSSVSNGLVVASQTTTTTGAGESSSGSGGFVLDGGSQVATPGAGVRVARVPFIARAIIKALEYIPL